MKAARAGCTFPRTANTFHNELAGQIALAHGRRLWQPRGAGRLLGALARRGGAMGKVFGTLTCDQRMSDAFRPAEETPFADSIRATEAGA